MSDEHQATDNLVAAVNSPTPTNRRWSKILGFALSIVLAVVAIFVLSSEISHLNWSDLRDAVAMTSRQKIALALAFTALSYFVLTGYDALALRQLKLDVPYRVTALASFTSYAVSFMLGFPLVTGGTVRYWIYSRAGLGAGKIASLTIVAGVTFWLGMALVISLGLLIEAPRLAALDHFSILFNYGAGAGVMSAIVIYLIWVSLRPRHTTFQGMRFELPGFKLTMEQMALGVMDLSCAAAVLYALLPSHHGLNFFTFAVIYVFACLLGIASHIPGGAVVFEAIMLKVLPAPSEEALAASLLLFRLIYYVIPFIVALILLASVESGRRWKDVRNALNNAKAQQKQL